MLYFSGEYEGKLDDKGRLVLPARMKSVLPEETAGRMVLVRGFEPCITLYPYGEWTKIFAQVAALNEFNAEYRAFQRNFLRGCMEVELDKAGRFVVPRMLLRHAGLSRDAIFVGLGNRAEIWDPVRYDDFLFKDQVQFATLAGSILGQEKHLPEVVAEAEPLAPYRFESDSREHGNDMSSILPDSELGE